MIQGFDPRTGEPVGEPVAETTDAEVDAIVAAALAAAPAWGAGTALAQRAQALEAVADALDDRAGELAVIADTETALGGERLIGEVARTTTQLRMFAGVLRDGSYDDAVVSPAEGVIPDVRRITRPVGPVAVFAASNFPFAFSVAGGDTASALAAGCPVVVKAHEAHPVTSDVTAEVVAPALASAGAPAGVFGLVHGVEAGLRLLRHPDIAAAGFTGSTARRAGPGPDLRGAAGPDPVLRRARLGQPRRGAARRRVLPSGRGRHRVRRVADPRHRPVLHQPRPALRPRGRGAAVRDRARRSAPRRAGRCCPAGSSPATRTRWPRPRITRVSPSWPPASREPGPWGATPRVFQLTLKEFAADLAVLSRERFGPAGLVITYPSVADLLPVLAALAGNLVGTVHADAGSPEDLDLARQVVAVLEHVAGRIVFNGWPTGVAVVPAQHHGGPWPATTVPAYTSVGTAAIRRWLVPVAYQNFPPELLPPGLA